MLAFRRWAQSGRKRNGGFEGSQREKLLFAQGQANRSMRTISHGMIRLGIAIYEPAGEERSPN